MCSTRLQRPLLSTWTDYEKMGPWPIRIPPLPPEWKKHKMTTNEAVKWFVVRLRLCMVIYCVFVVISLSLWLHFLSFLCLCGLFHYFHGCVISLSLWDVVFVFWSFCKNTHYENNYHSKLSQIYQLPQIIFMCPELLLPSYKIVIH